MESIALASLLALSLIAHIAQFAYLSHSRRRFQEALKTSEDEKKKKPLAVEAEELLRDLVTSGAIIRIERIDPESLLMWRSR